MPKFVITHTDVLMPEAILRRILVRHEIRSTPISDDMRTEFCASFNKGVPAILEILDSPTALRNHPRVFVGDLERPFHDYVQVEIGAQSLKVRNILRILGSFLFWRPKRLQQATEEAKLLLERMEEVLPNERRTRK